MDLIITSRMASTRLPNKALMEVVGHGPMLEILINRAKLSNKIDKVIIATTKLSSDDKLVEWAHQNNFYTYRGSENNVLKRLIDTCDHYNIECFVEILGDNPLVDPLITSKCINIFKKEKLRYVATMTKEYKYADLNSCFPIGIRVQVIRTELLHFINKNISTKYNKEHATSFLYDKPKLRNIKLIKNDIYKGKKDFINWNYAVNDIEGFNNMAFIISKLGMNFSWIDMVKLSKNVKMFNNK